MSTSRRRPRFSWLAPAVMVGLLPGTLTDAGFGSAAWGQVVSLAVGLAAGVVWYRLYPRPLAERLLPATVVLLGLYGSIAVASALLSGGRSGATFDSGNDLPELVAWIACVGALVLSEWWDGSREGRRGVERERDRRAAGDRVS